MIEGLVALNPQKRHSKVAWVMLAGGLCVLVALIADDGVREAVFSKPNARAVVASVANANAHANTTAKANGNANTTAKANGNANENGNPQLTGLGPRPLPMERTPPPAADPTPAAAEPSAPAAQARTNARHPSSPNKAHPSRRHGKRGPKA